MIKNLLLGSLSFAGLVLLASCGGGGSSVTDAGNTAGGGVVAAPPVTSIPSVTTTPPIGTPPETITPPAITAPPTSTPPVTSPPAPGGGGSAPPVPVSNVVLTPAAAIQHWGKTLQLQAVVTNFSGAVTSVQPVTYVSSDANVATVNNVGLVTLMNPGVANITATSGSATSNISAITVKGFVASSLAVSQEDNCVLDDTKSEIICWGDGYPIYPNQPL